MTDLPVKVTGNVPDKTMGRLGEALADLISPITETTGLIGDSLRFHREQMAERRISAARKKAQTLAIETRKVPYKFMVRWLEGATLENEESVLNELWENLLLAGMTSHENYLEIFVSILQELGGTEVAVLKQLVEGGASVDGGAGLVPTKGREGEFPPLFNPALEKGLDVHSLWPEILRIYDETKRPGFQLVGAVVSKDFSQSYCYHPVYHENFVAFELLTRERLLDIDKANAPAKIDGHDFIVITAKLTQLGVSFVRACMFPETLRRSPPQG